MSHELKTIETPSDPSMPKSIRRHLAVSSLLEVAGSVGAPGAFVFYRFWCGQDPSSVLDGIVFISLFIAGYLVPRAVFRHLIGAACPVLDCRGHAFPKGTKPVVYLCRACRWSYSTELFEGDDGQTLPGI